MFAVYRVYDAQKRLLYVGATCNPSSRLMSHAATQSWWLDAVSVDIAWCATEEEAARKELHAIQHEAPLHNRAGISRPYKPYQAPQPTPKVKTVNAIRLPSEERLTVAEASTAYQVSEKTIRRWAKDGVIRSERLGRTVRILAGLPAEHRNAEQD